MGLKAEEAEQELSDVEDITTNSWEWTGGRERKMENAEDTWNLA